MNESLSQALLVMVVGMITVFIVLGLVVLTGKLLIRFVNHFLPEAAKFSPKPSRTTPVIPTSTTSFNEKKLAAIVAAVDVVTKGQGRITNIEKLKNN